VFGVEVDCAFEIIPAKAPPSTNLLDPFKGRALLALPHGLPVSQGDSFRIRRPAVAYEKIKVGGVCIGGPESVASPAGDAGVPAVKEVPAQGKEFLLGVRNAGWARIAHRDSVVTGFH
jgi:hypothetical protein